MATCDYYKNQNTHELYYNQKMFVEANDKGEACVLIESEAGLPNCCAKGVWSVKQVAGATQYIPEGDPNYDKDAEQVVWGKTIASREVCELKNDDLYDEEGYLKYPFTQKQIESSRAYWATK